MTLHRTWMLLLVVGTLGCGERPAPVTESEPVAEEAKQSPIVPEVGQNEAIAAIEKLGGRHSLDEKERVVSVDLQQTQVTDDDLEYLKGLTTLQSLDLFVTQVSDAGLEHLKGMTSLQHLQLRRTQVSDAGLEHLKGLAKLESLDLSSTLVSDSGLEHLKGLTGLQELDPRGLLIITNAPSVEAADALLKNAERWSMGG